MKRKYGIPLVGFYNAVNGALIISQVVLIVDTFKFLNRFPDQPLIDNAAWKTGIDLMATLLVRCLEERVCVWIRLGNFLDAPRYLLDEIVWSHFWMIQIWLIVLFFVYCSLYGLFRDIGKREFAALFSGLGRQASP